MPCRSRGRGAGRMDAPAVEPAPLFQVDLALPAGISWISRMRRFRFARRPTLAVAAPGREGPADLDPPPERGRDAPSAGTEGGSYPTWSPDGRYCLLCQRQASSGFRPGRRGANARRRARGPRAGGVPTGPSCTRPRAGRTARHPRVGGTPRSLTTLERQREPRTAAALPAHGERLLYVVGSVD